MMQPARRARSTMLLLLVSFCALCGGGSAGIAELPSFEDNLYAQLLMNASSGSLFPADAYSAEDIYYMHVRGEAVVPTRKYDHAAREKGLDWPSVGHTMIGQCEIISFEHSGVPLVPS